MPRLTALDKLHLGNNCPDEGRLAAFCRDGLARPLGDLETDRLTVFALDDPSAMLDLSGSIDVSDLRPYQVAAAQLTVDGEIE